jgi:hypothetical protein
VNKEEIEKYLKAGRSHSICIDRALSIDFPGFVRTVTIREGIRVSVEYEVHGMDEGGAYYWANFPTLEDAIPVLESFLGKPMESWENFTRTGKYPDKPEGIDASKGHEKLKLAIAGGDATLPPPVFDLTSSYWKTFQQ